MDRTYISGAVVDLILPIQNSNLGATFENYRIDIPAQIVQLSCNSIKHCPTSTDNKLYYGLVA